MQFDLHIVSFDGSYVVFDPSAVEEAITAGRDYAQAIDDAAEEGRLLVCYDVSPGHRHGAPVVLRVVIDEPDECDADEGLRTRCHPVLNNARLSVPSGCLFGVGAEYLEVSDDWDGSPESYQPKRRKLVTDGQTVPDGEYRVRGYRVEWEFGERESLIDGKLGPDAVRTNRLMDRLIRGGCLSLALALMVTPLMLVVGAVAGWGAKWLFGIASVGVLLLLGGLFGIYRSASARYQQAAKLRYDVESEFPHGLLLLERIEGNIAEKEFTASKMAWAFA